MSVLTYIPQPTINPLLEQSPSRTSPELLNCAGMITTRRALEGWLLSSPTSMMISKMNVSKDMHPEPKTHSDTSADPKQVEKVALTCPRSSRQRQYRLSTSSNSPDPGMMDDYYGSSDSETSTEDEHNYHASTAELWDSFWSPSDDCFHSSKFLLDAQPEIPLCVQSLSSDNRNYASSNLSGLNKPAIQGDLHRSGAVRVSCPIRPNLPSATYSPFPPSPLAQHLPDRALQVRPAGTPKIAHAPHSSWPLRIDSQPSRPQRRRAHTTPSAPTHAKVIVPSNLSTCTTLDWQTSSSGEGTPLYMCSPTTSPLHAPPLMELLEKSVFDDDDEDDEKSGIGALVSKLHTRKTSSGGGTGSLGRASAKRPKRQSLKRCMSEANEALKGVFGIKKADV